MDDDAATASGLPNGELLLRFAEALVRADDDVADRRAELIATIGAAAAGHAVATVTAFSGLVRVADGTGIPIDDGLAEVSVDIRDQLGLDGLGGSANSALGEVEAAAFDGVGRLFGGR
ncbi:MAG: hypothetical protein AAF547_18940 [Actinomycetota bacterium]